MTRSLLSFSFVQMSCTRSYIYCAHVKCMHSWNTYINLSGQRSLCEFDWPKQGQGAAKALVMQMPAVRTSPLRHEGCCCMRARPNSDLRRACDSWLSQKQGVCFPTEGTLFPTPQHFDLFQRRLIYCVRSGVAAPPRERDAAITMRAPIYIWTRRLGIASHSVQNFRLHGYLAESGRWTQQ